MFKPLNKRDARMLRTNEIISRTYVGWEISPFYKVFNMGKPNLKFYTISYAFPIKKNYMQKNDLLSNDPMCKLL